MSDGENTQAFEEALNGQGQVSWGQVAKGGRGSGAPRSLYSQVDKLKLKDSGTQYKLRLIGQPFPSFKLYEPIEVNLDKDYNKDLEVFTAGNKPSMRFAVWVFDRNDGNKIKLFEGGAMIFRQFGSYQEIINEDPGGESGPDWSVSFSDPVGDNGKKNPRLRQYRCMHLKEAPFTEEEKKQIAEHCAKYPYSEVIKGSDDDYVNKLWEEAKNAPEGALVPGSYLWNMARRESRENEKKQADQDLNLDAPKGQATAATAATVAPTAEASTPAVDASAGGDGFDASFETGTPASEGTEAKQGGTSLF